MVRQGGNLSVEFVLVDRVNLTVFVLSKCLILFGPSCICFEESSNWRFDFWMSLFINILIIKYLILRFFIIHRFRYTYTLTFLSFIFFLLFNDGIWNMNSLVLDSTWSLIGLELKWVLSKCWSSSCNHSNFHSFFLCFRLLYFHQLPLQISNLLFLFLPLSYFCLPVKFQDSNHSNGSNDS